FSSRRRHTRSKRDWSSDVCSSDLLQHLEDDRAARDAEGVADLLRLLGPMTRDEIIARSVPSADVDVWLRTLAGAGRAVVVDHAEIGRAACRERGVRRGGAGAGKN